MARDIELNELRAVLADLSYPATRAEVLTAVGETTVSLADGETTLAAVLGDSTSDRFDSVDDLESDIRSNLPRRAVGEPYQSEGEG
jgi:hypothetical protein